MKLSVVIPVHNEEGNLAALYSELKETLQQYKSYEIIFVDDGSRDNSLKVLKNIKDKNIKIVKLLSNYGQSTALAAGIEQASGDIVVTMDSDLQHDPKDIPSLIEPLNKGFHVVCGWRKYRGDSDSLLKKTIPSRLSNLMIKLLTHIKLNDVTGGMRAFKKEVTDNIQIYGEMHRYLPILAIWKGFKVTEVPIHIRKRGSGKTNYNAKRLFRGFLDLITIKFFVSYSTKPLHIFGGFGIILFILGFFTGLWVLLDKFIYGVSIVKEHQPLLMLTILLVILGINFFCFGLIADMVTLDAITSKQRKTYVVEKII